MPRKLKPKVGESYKNSSGSRLRITEVVIPDRLGREIRGRIKVKKNPMRDYSCTLEMWREIWRDKNPPIPVSAMKGV